MSKKNTSNKVDKIVTKTINMLLKDNKKLTELAIMTKAMSKLTIKELQAFSNHRKIIQDNTRWLTLLNLKHTIDEELQKVKK